MSTIKHKLLFARPSTKYLKYFFDIKSIVCDLVANLEEQGVDPNKQDIQGLISKHEKKFIKDKEVVNSLKDSEKGLSEKGQQILNSITVTNKNNRVALSFDIDTTADVYQSFGRGSRVTTKNVNITNKTAFEVRNKYLAFENESFTLAILEENYKLSLTVETGDSGIKGDIILKAIEMTETNINIDDCKKYFNVEDIVRGINI